MTTPPIVTASVGTDHHPFSRLVAWMQRWSWDHPEVEVFVQRGTNPALQGVANASIIPHEELLERFTRSAAVVTHGGPATIMDARRTGHVPIVVPRTSSRNEHVDDHQVLFSSRLAALHQVHLATDYDDLAAHLDRALRDPAHTTAVADTEESNLAIRRLATAVARLERRLGDHRSRHWGPVVQRFDDGLVSLDPET